MNELSEIQLRHMVNNLNLKGMNEDITKTKARFGIVQLL
jgi:hypothetical protein